MQLTMQDNDFSNPKLIEGVLSLLVVLGTVDAGKDAGQSDLFAERRANDIVVSPAEVFAKSEAPEVPLAPEPPAPSTAAVAPSPTAHAEAPATSLPPTPAAATPPSVPAGGAVDVHGRVWDERIHASTRAQNKDGSWRYRKNVAQELIATVETQLDGKPAITPAAPAVPEAPAAPAVPPAPPAPTVDLGFVMTTVMGGLGAGRYTQARLGEVLQGLGIPTLQDLPKRPDQYRPFLEALGESVPA